MFTGQLKRLAFRSIGGRCTFPGIYVGFHGLSPS